MQLKKKYFLRTSLVAMIIVGLVFVVNHPLQAVEFEGNEGYWSEVCAVPQSDASISKACKEYKAYLTDRKNEKANESASAQEKINQMQGDINQLKELSAEYTLDLEAVNQEVASINESIAVSESSIETLQIQIDEQKQSIEERQKTVAERMVEIQVSMNTNEYINFIMGSENLIQFAQRSRSLQVFTESDNKMIEELNADMLALKADQDEQSRIREMLVTQKDVLVSKQEEAQSLKVANDTVYAAVLNESQALASQRDSANSEAGELSQAIGAIDVSPPSPPASGGNTGGNSGGNTGGNTGGGGGNTAPANFYGPYYNAPGNIFAPAYTGQCTWYVWGRANELSGNAYRNLPTGHAATWLWVAASRGYATGSTPRANSIAVWAGYFGHVAYVESYNGGMMRLTEANIGAPGGGLGMYPGLETAIRYTRDTTLSYSEWIQYRGAPIGFIYL